MTDNNDSDMFDISKTIGKYNKLITRYKTCSWCLRVAIILSVVIGIGCGMYGISLLFDDPKIGSVLITLGIACVGCSKPLSMIRTQTMQKKERLKRLLYLDRFEENKKRILESLKNNPQEYNAMKIKIKKVFYLEKHLMNVKSYSLNLFSTNPPWSYKQDEEESKDNDGESKVEV